MVGKISLNHNILSEMLQGCGDMWLNINVASTQEYIQGGTYPVLRKLTQEGHQQNNMAWIF